MRVSVFGLGYVGAVSCACFSRDGHDVIGVDVNADKVKLVNAGRTPVVEEGVADLLTAGVSSGKLRATVNAQEAVLDTDVSVISVGTPSQANGGLCLAAVRRVCEQIGQAVGKKRERHLVVVRSTVLPGSTRSVVVPAIEKAARKCLGDDFGVCFNPEFLREGSSVSDFYNPAYTIIGAWDQADGRRVGDLYDRVGAPQHIVGPETAEMLKYVSNAFHALKVSFANEIGSLAHPLGVDSHRVMDLLCKDTKLNISARYLKPGFAFGGSCLPKDVRALLYRARSQDVELPLIRATLTSNEQLIQRLTREILDLKKRKIAMLGLSFKAGTDDLRESPLVAMTETLLGKGLDIRIFDEQVSTARLVGANKDYIEREIPHLSSLLVPEMAEAVSYGDVVVVGNQTPLFRELPKHLRAGQVVFDLVRIPGLEAQPNIDYRGIAW